ncbi:DNA polymerase epsilon subunit B-like [Zingiber officinale]|uniref:DNA polymerase epsilon subunit B-like n=1 Tax=Zingiber officinale TaxID=94328 RepID=UPI001C4B8271|nr:DNA polymerase epsilon subunit B-like [Zingiber officinale]
MVVSGRTRKKVQHKFKLRGFTFKVDAMEEVLAYLAHFPNDEDEALDLLIDEMYNKSLHSSILDREVIHDVVASLLEAHAAPDNSARSTSDHAVLRVIDVFHIHRFHYDGIKKVFYEHTGKLPIHGDAVDKAALYRDRYQLLFQRISRDKYFSRPVFATEMTESESCEITSIQSLIGCTGRRWIMGVISQLEEGQFYLEDLAAAVPIDLSNSKITAGFLVENTVIVAEGELLPNGIFQVNTCGFPPLEDREVSLKLLMGLDFFGGGVLSNDERSKLLEMEKAAVNHMLVILSDVWLDNEETMEKLAVVFDAYEGVEVVPYLFILMGNFCSRPCHFAFHSYSNLRMQFGKLGEMIASHPRLKEQSKFLLIPGPDDAGSSKVLPRCALPKYLTEEFQKHIPNAIFSSNPCRVKFYTQEIVFFRQDLLYRMRRASLIPPPTEETNDHFEHLVVTITHQSHLCPLPLTVQPIIWNYDHCLRLYPTPHMIVLADKSEQKSFKYTGITCVNPGSFSSDNSFAVYRPCTQEVELSALDG